MRSSIIALTLLAVTCGLAFSQSNNSNPPQNSDISMEGVQGTLTGCLSGKPSEYTVTDQNGTKHMIMSPEVDLTSYVGHKVELTGMNGTRRDASASSTGKVGAERWFKVAQVTKDLGPCK
jgi:hypothetical protein